MEVVNNARVIGGMTRKCAQAAAQLYRIFVHGECHLTNARTADRVRRRVAEDNLRRASPGWPEDERRRILRDHYRELGRVAAEYARLADLARAPMGEVVVAVRGEEHAEAVRRGGRGAVLVTGHFGNFELAGAALAQAHGVDFVARPQSNAAVDEWINRQRRAAGVGVISAADGIRGVFASLKQNRWVAMVADQDARSHGVFVPFLGRPASTAVGPARISIATRAPILMGVISRRADGRHEIDLEPPLEPPQNDDDDAVTALTRAHVAMLERWVMKKPESWFWLHRRWKTSPPTERPA